MFKLRKNRENNIEGGRGRREGKKKKIWYTINYVVISWNRGLLRWGVIKFDGEPRVSIVQSELLTLNSRFIGWILFHLRFVESPTRCFLKYYALLQYSGYYWISFIFFCTNNLSLLIFFARSNARSGRSYSIVSYVVELFTLEMYNF